MYERQSQLSNFKQTIQAILKFIKLIDIIKIINGCSYYSLEFEIVTCKHLKMHYFLPVKSDFPRPFIYFKSVQMNRNVSQCRVFPSNTFPYPN